MPHSLFKRTTTTTTEEILLSLKTNNNKIKGENNMSYTNKTIYNNQKSFYTNKNNSKKHHHKYNKTNNLSSDNNQTEDLFDNEVFKKVVIEFFEEEERRAKQTLIPNARNFEKYLFVKEQLNKIAKSNHTQLEESHCGLNADFVIKLYVLGINEIKIISEMSKFCSAIGIDAELNGKLTLCATVPDVFLAYEEELAKRKNNTQPKQSII